MEIQRKKSTISPKHVYSYSSLIVPAFVGILLICIILFFINNQSQKNTTSNSHASGIPSSAGQISQQQTGYPTINMDKTTWKTYTLKTIGFEFKLPTGISNRVGGLKETVDKGQTGTIYHASFENGGGIIPSNDFAIFGADSTDFSAGRSAIFTDLIGYSLSNRTYYTKYHSSDGYRPVTIPNESIIGEITNPNGIRILKIKNVPSTTPYGNFIFMSTPVGALINTSNPTYPGLVFQMNLSGKVNEAVFDEILSTFKFVY